MRDEKGRRAANGRGAISGPAHRLIEGFRKLIAIQYAAPWKAPGEECRNC